MKKKLLALICALALVFSLVSCTISAPDTVGSIGDFEITSGMYLLAQYGAYQQAAQLAGTDQDTTDVKAFLKETITTDSDSGETAVVSDYVAQKTQETLETLAAVDARFKALGGELTAEQLSTADRYAQQMMDQYGDTYTANGIGLETVKAYERLQVEHTALLDMVYGPDGETPVEDDELTSHLDDSMYEICYISIPLYNTSTYAFANDDQKTEITIQKGAGVDANGNAIDIAVDAQGNKYVLGKRVNGAYTGYTVEAYRKYVKADGSVLKEEKLHTDVYKSRNISYEVTPYVEPEPDGEGSVPDQAAV